jgi:glycosyltransferase involved in cell wall biosynthesis
MLIQLQTYTGCRLSSPQTTIKILHASRTVGYLRNLDKSTSQFMCVTIIIPVLNECECIGPLLAEIPAGLVGEVVIVDNGSSDNTGAAARSAAARMLTPTRIIEEPRRGYGYACLAGAKAASGDILVFMDGDGSFIPGELRRLLEPLDEDKAELALGSRFLGNLRPGVMPAHQVFGNWLVAMLLRWFYDLQITDLGPFRAIRREALFSLDMQELTYGWPVEMMVKVARQRKNIAEVPVSYRPRFAGQSKVGGTWRGTFLAAYRILRVVFRYAA